MAVFDDIDRIPVTAHVLCGDSTFYMALFRLLVNFDALEDFALAIGIPSLFLLKLGEHQEFAKISERTFVTIMRPVAWLIYNGSVQVKDRISSAAEMRRILDPIAEADPKKEVRQIILAAIRNKLRLRIVDIDNQTPEDKLMRDHAMTLFYKTDKTDKTEKTEKDRCIFGWFTRAGEPKIPAQDSADEIIGGVEVLRVMHLTFSMKSLHELCTTLASSFDNKTSNDFTAKFNRIAHAQASAKEIERRAVECRKGCADRFAELGVLEQYLTAENARIKVVKEETRGVKNDRAVIDAELARLKKAFVDASRKLAETKGKLDETKGKHAEAETLIKDLALDNVRMDEIIKDSAGTEEKLLDLAATHDGLKTEEARMKAVIADVEVDIARESVRYANEKARLKDSIEFDEARLLEGAAIDRVRFTEFMDRLKESNDRLKDEEALIEGKVNARTAALAEKEALLADKEKAMLAVSNELEATMKYTNNLNKALECAKLKNAATKALIDDAYTHEQTLKATLDGMASSTAQRMQLVVDAWKATMTMKPVRISAPEVNTV